MTSGPLVRPLLAVAVSLAVVLFVFEMSGSAQRTAGSDHVSPKVFVATLPGGGRVCRPVAPLPSDAAEVQVLIGTYGRPAPALGILFFDEKGSIVAAGSLPPGEPQGYVDIPITEGSRATSATSMCLHTAGYHETAVAGDQGPAESELVNGQPQPGDVSLIYLRAGSESWWQLFPTLISRFGLGKAAFFGDWTLPAMVLLIVGVWFFTIRLLARELT